jgi:hypothetical protein
MIVVFSDKAYEQVVPPSAAAVRGWMHVGGWYLENLNDKETRATIITELDFKGSVPQFAIKGSNVVQGA